MKKTLLPAVIALSMSSFVFGQVGINTTDPKSTFDVHGKTDTGGVSLPTDITGLQAPRLTRAEITAKGDTLYGVDQKGALVYITDVTGGDALTQRMYITKAGYYYFDGTLWQAIASGTPPITGDSNVDITNDAWINNPTNTRVELGTNSDGTTARTAGTAYAINDKGATLQGDYTSAIAGLPAGAAAYNVKNLNSDILPTVASGKSLYSNYNSVNLLNGFSPNANITGVLEGVTKSSTNTSNYGNIRSLVEDSQLFGSGSVTSIGAITGRASLYDTNTATTVTAVEALARIGGSSTATNGYGFKSTVTAETASTLTNGYSFYGGFTKTGTAAITNAYGLYLDNINAGSTLNYAIYTNAGKVRFGDLAAGAATDNIVTVDATGVLKTLSASAVGSSAEPWYNTATSTPATANTQNIYQTGKVSTGFDNPSGYDFGHQLNVKGHISTKRWGTAPNLVQTRYNGTEAAPTAVLLDDQVGAISFEAFAGGGITGARPSVANITSWAAENTSATTSAGKLVFATVPVGSITPNQRLTITETGNVGIGLPSSVGLLRPSNPTNKLHVSATANPVRIEGLVAAAATDNLVTIDANGVLTKSTATAASSANNWGLTGNAGTTPGTNFLGTTDAQGLIFKVNNFQSGYIDPTITNTSFGYSAGSALTTGNYNTAFGYNALLSTTTASSNAAFGREALKDNTIGRQNTAVGQSSMSKNIDGTSNAAFGNGALYSHTTGDENTAIGKDALYANTTGQFNVALGTSALRFSTTGIRNIALGYNAAYNLTTGNKNIAIGDQANLPSNTADNQMNIGNTIFGTGMTGTLAAPAGRIGIGVSTLDFAKLDSRETLTADATGLIGTNYVATNGALTLNHSAASSSQTYRGLNASVTTPATNATSFTNRLYGGSTSVNHQGSGNVAQAAGFYGATFQNNASSVISNNFGVIAEARVNNGLSNNLNALFATVVSDPTSTIKQPVALGVRGDVNVDGAGAAAAYGFSATASKLNNVDNYYSYFVHSSAETTASTGNKYAFYSNANINSWFKGSLGIGTAAGVANAKLHVVAAASDLTPAIIEGAKDISDANADGSTNDEATTAGIPIGGLYRTGDILKIRH